jgi:hypothetical protein
MPSPGNHQSHDTGRPPPEHKGTWLQTLVLYEQVGTTSDRIKLAPGNPLYDQVVVGIRHAFTLLHTPNSYDALTTIGKGVWKEWYGQPANPEDMDSKIHLFLQTLDRKFVEIVLTKYHPYNGAYYPVTWYEPSKGIFDWDPHNGGFMSLNHFVRPP